MQNTAAPSQHRFTLSVLLLSLFTYCFSRFLQIDLPHLPMLAVVAFHVIPAAVFAWFHGAALYGIRGILAFFAACLIVGNIVENIGVRTGWPFGHYYFTGLMGPKFLVVPILLGGAYIGMGYTSWIFGRLILGKPTGSVSRAEIITTPLVAAFIMVAWDFSMDSIWSTVMHAWIWQEGGAYFGVPVSNFFGWYLNNFVIYLLFAVYLRFQPVKIDSVPPLYWRLAIAFYAASAGGNLLLLIPSPNPAVVTDPSGTMWRVADITAATALVSLFVMGAFVVMAVVQLPKTSPSHNE
jgi:putative membrane protein